MSTYIVRGMERQRDRQAFDGPNPFTTANTEVFGIHCWSRLLVICRLPQVGVIVCPRATLTPQSARSSTLAKTRSRAVQGSDASLFRPGGPADHAERSERGCQPRLQGAEPVFGGRKAQAHSVLTCTLRMIPTSELLG